MSENIQNQSSILTRIVKKYKLSRTQMLKLDFYNKSDLKNCDISVIIAIMLGKLAKIVDIVDL